MSKNKCLYGVKKYLNVYMYICIYVACRELIIVNINVCMIFQRLKLPVNDGCLFEL